MDAVEGGVHAARQLDRLGNPGDAGIIGFSLSSKYTCGRHVKRSARERASASPVSRSLARRSARSAAPTAEHPDHVEDLGTAALLKGVHCDAALDQLRDNTGLKIGKGEDQVGLQIENFRDVGRSEG
jgi:hypothetical protein